MAKHWKHQNGQKIMIKNDKPLSFEFGMSEVWNEKNQRFDIVNHSEEMWVRHSTDYKDNCRKCNILIDSLNLESFDWTSVKFNKCDKPKVRKRKIDDTLSLCNDDNDFEMIEYYKSFTIDDSKESEVRSQSPKLCFNKKYYYIQMQRIQTYITNCKNMEKKNFTLIIPPKHSSKKRGGSKRKRDDDDNPSELPDQKKTKFIPCNCDKKKNWIDSAQDWKQLAKKKTRKQIISQLADHRVSTKGIKGATKTALQQKLKEHYIEQHPQQWKACTNTM